MPPEVPIYTAPGGLALPHASFRSVDIPVDPRFAAGSALVQTAQKVLQHTAESLSKIRQMRETDELVNLHSRWDAGVKQIHLDLTQDPGVIARPETYGAEWFKRSEALRGEIAKDASSKNVEI